MGMLLAGLLAGMCSCSRVKRITKGPVGPSPASAYSVPPIFRGAGGGQGNPEVKVTLQNPADLSGEEIEQLRSREEDLMWTDPDNPEQGMEGMEEVMAQSARRGPWLLSYSEARRAAMRAGKPILVWFTDTARSPLCRALSGEVFSLPGFEQWASEEVIRVRLDFNVKGVSHGPGHSAMDDQIRKENYLKTLKKRYKVLGLPTVLLMSPDGTVTSRYRGYQKTYHDFYLARLKNDVKATRKHHDKWKERMAGKGYRDWLDTKGRTVFAKLTRYSGGEMILVEPDGKQLLAKERNLSNADQAWIAAQKAKRP